MRFVETAIEHKGYLTDQWVAVKDGWHEALRDTFEAHGMFSRQDFLVIEDTHDHECPDRELVIQDMAERKARIGANAFYVIDCDPDNID